jgi:hypothetical protein
MDVEPESQVGFPGLLERVVADGTENLGLRVRPLGRWAPLRSGASVNDQNRGTGQTGIIKLARYYYSGLPP